MAPVRVTAPRSAAIRPLFAAAAIAVVLLAIAGCQKSLDVSAVNECGRPVEARAESLREITVGWSKIEPGGRDHIVSEIDDARQLYVEVRRNEADTPIEFTVDVADLPKPSEGDDDVEIVLEGERCP